MKIAIIGGGASGLACAVECGRRAEKENKSVQITVYEANDKVGKKLLATGNGRCNMLNKNEAARYFGDEAFTRFALEKFNVESNLSFFASMGLYTRSDEEGRVYPLSNQASSVLDALRFECERLGVEFVCSQRISEIRPSGDGFKLLGKKADKIVLACGGKASVRGYEAYELLKNFGHTVIKPAPALTKITVRDTKFVKQLKGIRHKGNVSLTVDGKIIARENGEMQFTDYGLSGIAVMQLSSHISGEKSEDIKIIFDTVPDFSHAELENAILNIKEKNSSLICENLLSGFMPKKLGMAILKKAHVNLGDKISSLSTEKVKEIASLAKKLTFEFEALRSFEDAQVTSGGADTRQFYEKTMESKRIKGLYCVGEMLNVDGPCGGYNLMWAWSSGRLCGLSLIK